MTARALVIVLALRRALVLRRRAQRRARFGLTGYGLGQTVALRPDFKRSVWLPYAEGGELPRGAATTGPVAMLVDEWPASPPHGYAEAAPGVWRDPASDYEWQPRASSDGTPSLWCPVCYGGHADCSVCGARRG